MKSNFTKITAATLVLFSLLQCAVFARMQLDEYTGIDYMDDVLKYDYGDFSSDITQQTEGENKYYMNILYKFGIYSQEDMEISEDTSVTYAQFYGYVSNIITGDTQYGMLYQNGDYEGKITLGEALKTVVDMLGYEKIRTDENILSIAQSEKLLSGIEYNAERYTNIGELARLLWNALNAYGMDSEYTGTGITYFKADTVLMQRRLNIYKITGFVNAANGINVFKNEAPQTGYVQIDRADYLSGTSGAEELLGSRATVYFYEEDDEKTIKYIETDRTNNTLTIDFKNIENVGDYIEYYDGENELKRANISDISYVLYNGDATHDFSVMYDYEDMDGYVTFSKSEKNGVFDTAVIVSYNYFVVYSVDSYEQKIYLKDNAMFMGENYVEIPDDEYMKFTLDSVECAYTDFAPGNVIRVVQNTLKTYTIIDAAAQTVTGKIENINKYDSTLTINSVTYRIAKNYEHSSTAPEMTLSLYGTFYVSRDGYIAGFKNASEATYGYLKRLYLDEETEEKVYAQVFTQDGEWKVFEFKETLTVDGEEKVKAMDAFERLKAGNATQKLIRYKLNAKGIITFIDSMIDDSWEADDEERLVQVYAGEVTQSYRGGKWFRNDPGYRILDGEPVFQIPRNLEKTNLYKVLTGSSLNSDETKLYLQLYTADELGLCSVGLISETAVGTTNESDYFYCESVSNIWNEDEDAEMYSMEGILMQGSNGMREYTIYVTEEKKETIEDKNAIAPGTLMRVTYDSDKYLSGCDVIFTQAQMPEDYYSGANAYYQQMVGTIQIIDTETGYMSLLIQQSGMVDKTSVFNADKVLLIDSTDFSCREISMGDLRVGEKMYVAKIAGDARYGAVIR